MHTYAKRQANTNKHTHSEASGVRFIDMLCSDIMFPHPAGLTLLYWLMRGGDSMEMKPSLTHQRDFLPAWLFDLIYFSSIWE